MRGERGAALFLVFLMMLVLSGLALAVGVAGHNSVVGGKSQLLDKQAFYIAEAGWQKARTQVTAGDWAAGNTYTESFGAGEYRVTVTDNGDDTTTLTSEGYVPDQTNTVAKRQVVEVRLAATSNNLSLTATASASSSKGSNTPDRSNDGDTATHWEADTPGDGEWLAMDHGSAVTLDQIVILENNKIDGIASVESSSDGSSWSPVSGLSVVESPSKTWTADFTAASARHFRVTFTASGSSQRVSVEEYQSFDTSSASLSLGEGVFTTAW